MSENLWAYDIIQKIPFSIVETPTFSQKEIEEALGIAIWVQILTFYYPSVSKIFE